MWQTQVWDTCPIPVFSWVQGWGTWSPGHSYGVPEPLNVVEDNPCLRLGLEAAPPLIPTISWLFGWDRGQSCVPDLAAPWSVPRGSPEYLMFEWVPAHAAMNQECGPQLQAWLGSEELYAWSQKSHVMPCTLAFLQSQRHNYINICQRPTETKFCLHGLPFK